jgi:predicted AlkP superfamily phosphohydrolase/phosphomutase
MRFNSRKNKRIVGVGLDGFPHSLALQLMEGGVMPNLAALAKQGALKKIHSVHPTVSGVAWSAFQTGKNPAEFGVFGFVELKPDFDLYIPNHNDLKCRTIWKQLDTAGKKFASLGIPMTYPPPKGSGFVVSGFLAPELNDAAVSTSDVLERLRKTGYEIDIDPTVAAKSLERFKADLTRVSQARQRTALSLLAEERDWDFFFVHVMDTDRLNHFMWACQYEQSGPNRDFFFDFYRGIDEFLGQVRQTAGDDYGLMICSDHGFCELKCEFQLNRWLREQGYLDYENAPQKAYKAVRPGSRAVSLVPGRVYILREGVWQAGAVAEAQYEPLREELIEKLGAVVHPETGEAVCKKVFKREEVFKGRFIQSAPDLVIDPCDGFDLQSRLGAGKFFDKGPRTGMHTYENAMLWVSPGLADIAEATDIAEVGHLTAKHML